MTITSPAGGSIPLIGLGTWPMDDAEAERVVAEAIGLGYRLVDTAYAYGNETGVGRGVAASGIAREDVLAGTQTYVDLTGDVDGATGAMSAFARISQASGASVSDVATATAALKTAMKLDPANIEAAFSGLIVQGKKGAVSLRDFAGELASLAPQFAQFKGGTDLAGIREMGAAFQVIRNGAGSASQAATQFEALMSELVQSHQKLGAIGIKVFEKDGKSLRNFSKIMDDIANSKGLDPAHLQDIFGRKESRLAVLTIRDQIKTMHELEAAGLNTGAVQEDLNTRLNSNIGRLDVAMNNLKLAIADALTPERIKAFVDVLEVVLSKIGMIIDGWSALKDLATGSNDWEKSPFSAQAQGDQNSSRSWFDVATGIATGGASDMSRRMQNGAAASIANDILGKDQGPVGRSIRDQAAQDAAYNDAVSYIKGGGNREEQIRRAVSAAYNQSGGNFGQGNAAAGQAYIAGKGISSAQVEETRTAIAVTQVAGQIRKAIEDGFANAKTTVKMDGSAVAKSVDNAPAANRGGSW